MKIALRILTSPFILIMILISYNFHALRRWYLFLRYGGEFINYHDKDRTTIEDIYNQLKKANETT